MFKTASKEGYRYPTSRGQVTTEDLWDMPLTGQFSLNNTALSLDAKVEAGGKKSFVGTTTGDPLSEAKLEVVKAVIADKQADATARTDAKALKAKKQKLMELINAKEDEALGGKSLAELTAELAAL